MSLRDADAARMAAPGDQPDGARRPQAQHPAGWEPGVAWDGTTGTITTAPLERAPGSWDELLAVWDLDPAVYEVVEPVQYRAWDGPVAGGETRRMFYYRATVRTRRAPGASVDDLLGVIASWRRPKRPAPSADGLPAFVIAPGDLQLGKIDGEGDQVQATIDRFLGGIDRAVVRYRALRRAGRVGGTIYLALLGDCVEGFNSQGGGNTWRTTLTLTEQVRVYRRLVLEAVKALAGVADQLVVATVPGNHGEAIRLHGKMATRYDDSFDVDGVAAVAETCAESEKLRDVAFVFPRTDELTVTLDVAGTIVGLAHGHQFRSGGPMKWWAGQAHGMQPVGDATLLLAGHLHHLRVEQSGAKTFVQVPALDGGSTWWRHLTGQDSPPGLVTLAVGGGGWSGLEVL